MVVSIIDYGKAGEVIETIRESFESYFPDKKIVMLGPLLRGRREETYADYEKAFEDVTADEVTRYLRDDSTHVVPSRVYDSCFNALLDEKFSIAEERECEYFDAAESYLRLRKTGHYLCVALRNRGLKISRSDLIKKLETTRAETYPAGDFVVVFGFKYFMRCASVDTVSASTYIDFCRSGGFKKFSNRRGVAGVLAECCSQRGKRYVIVLPDVVYDFYEKNKLDVDVKKNVTVFSERSLAFDPTKSTYSAEHEKCDEEKVAKLTEIYGSLDNFPILFRDDIISKWFGFEEGDLIQINRKGSVYFRVVREAF